MRAEIGKLNKRITILRRDYPVVSGVQTITETTLRQCWAQVTTQSVSKIASGNSLTDDDVEACPARFFCRDGGAEVERLDIIRYNNDDYDIQYVHRYEGDGFVEMMATRHLLRSKFIAKKLCTIYNVANIGTGGACKRTLTEVVKLLTAQRSDGSTAMMGGGQKYEQDSMTVRLLRTEAISTDQLCGVDGELYKIAEISQGTDASGLLITDLTLENPGDSWRARYGIN